MLNEKNFRLAVADAHPAIREGIARIVERESGLSVSATAGSTAEIIEKLDGCDWSPGLHS